MNGSPAEVVFELGLNHMGDELRALRMVDALKAQGASHITIQVLSDVASFTRNTGTIELLQKHCMSLAQNLKVIRHATAVGLKVGATILDPAMVDELLAAGVQFFKILSADLTYDRLIQKACATGLPVYLSTGAATLEEIAHAVELVRLSEPKADLRLIHTVLVVPTPPELLNLRNIPTLRSAFGLPVAYGQHSDINQALDFAVAAGAQALFIYVAETRQPELPDGPHAIECKHAGEFIRRIGLVEQIMGTHERVVSERESGARTVARRSIVAARRIEKGHVVAEEDIAYKRPRSGLDPWDHPLVIGKTATSQFDEGQDLIAMHIDESRL